MALVPFFRPKPVVVRRLPPAPPEPQPLCDAEIRANARKKLADACGLWEACEAAACRRARACAGDPATGCIVAQKATLAPLLPALRRRIDEAGRAGPRDAAPDAPTPAPRKRRGSGRRRRRRAKTPGAPA